MEKFPFVSAIISATGIEKYLLYRFMPAVMVALMRLRRPAPCSFNSSVTLFASSFIMLLVSCATIMPLSVATKLYVFCPKTPLLTLGITPRTCSSFIEIT